MMLRLDTPLLLFTLTLLLLLLFRVCTRLAGPTSVLIEWNLSVLACQEGNRQPHMHNGFGVHVHAWYALYVRAHLVVI
jgi:hypothetical protein